MDSREKAKNKAWEELKSEGVDGWEASPFEMFDAGWQARDAEIESLRQQLAERDAMLAKKDDALTRLANWGDGIGLGYANDVAREALALKPKEQHND
jgi:hypothetical protein